MSNNAFLDKHGEVLEVRRMRVACPVPGNGDGHTLATTSVHDHTIESPETGLVASDLL